MKTKLPVIICVFLLSLSASAQENSGKTESSVFLKAGLNLANVSISGEGDVDHAKMLPFLQAKDLKHRMVLPKMQPILKLQPTPSTSKCR
jgi:hypothetical protein